MHHLTRLALCLATSLALTGCAQPAHSPAHSPGQRATPENQATQAKASQSGAMRVETIASGLEHPWAVALLPEGGFLVTERPGRLRRIAADGTLSAPIAGVPEVFAEGQGGLLDVVLDPAYASNKRIWLSFAEPGEGDTAGTAVTTATLGATALGDVRVVYRQLPKLEGGNHFGSRIAFDGIGGENGGHVFISHGSENSDEANALCAFIEGCGVKCWIGRSSSEVGSCGRCWSSTPTITTATVRTAPWGRHPRLGPLNHLPSHHLEASYDEIDSVG